MNSYKFKWFLKTFFIKHKFKKVGKKTYIAKPIFLNNAMNMSIGNRCRIYPGIRVEIVDKNSYISIGDNVSIGQNFHIVSYSDTLIIKDNVTISGNVFISNCNHSYDIKVGKSFLENQLDFKKTCIGTNCFIGYGAVLLPGSVLGDNCIVGANSVVKGFFPNYVMIAGNPARIIKKYNLDENRWEKVE